MKRSKLKMGMTNLLTKIILTLVYITIKVNTSSSEEDIPIDKNNTSNKICKIPTNWKKYSNGTNVTDKNGNNIPTAYKTWRLCANHKCRIDCSEVSKVPLYCSNSNKPY